MHHNENINQLCIFKMISVCMWSFVIITHRYCLFTMLIIMARKLALVTNPNDISFIPESHIVEGDNFLQQRVL